MENITYRSLPCLGQPTHIFLLCYPWKGEVRPVSMAGGRERSETVGDRVNVIWRRTGEGLYKSVFTISYSAVPKTARKYWASPGGGCWGPAPVSLHFLEGILCPTPQCGVSCTTKDSPRLSSIGSYRFLSSRMIPSMGGISTACL